MIVCGIDPGLSGALAIVNNEHDCESILMPTMGEKAQKLVDGGAIARFLNENDVEFAVVELVSARPGQGVSSMFRFGAAYGVMLGVLHSLCIPHKFVSPAKWKREIAELSDSAGYNSRHLLKSRTAF